jgi:hypothetical protein
VKNRRAVEQLRQEREAFEQAKTQGVHWFRLRLCMGYASLFILFGVAAACSYIVLNPAGYSTAVITIAATTLLVDIASLAASISKLVLQHNNAARLKPVTAADPPPTRTKPTLTA